MIFDSFTEVLGALFLALAVAHSFLVGPLRNYERSFQGPRALKHFLHLMSEIEVVFGFWASLFVIAFGLRFGAGGAVQYLEQINFTEPLFVLAIMVLCSSEPVLRSARAFLTTVAGLINKALRIPAIWAEVFTVLTVGPLLGSFITEPAAMTVTALLLAGMIHTANEKMLYALIATLLVNVSIGGALTSFAAPPILMVADAWDWDTAYVFTHFGWKAGLAVLTNGLIFVLMFRERLAGAFYTLRTIDKQEEKRMPVWVGFTHLAFLVGVVLAAHHPPVFLGLLALYLGLYAVTKEFQKGLRWKESALVAFFLAGIIVLGPVQTWWLKPLIASLSDTALFLGATALTAVTDNAALTYLSSRIPGLTELSKYALVAGAIAGGGLTVIANAPNPAGVALLSPKFPGRLVSPVKLFTSALIPTLVAVGALWFL